MTGLVATAYVFLMLLKDLNPISAERAPKGPPLTSD